MSEEQEKIFIFVNDFDYITDALYTCYKTSVADRYYNSLKFIKEKLENEYFPEEIENE